MKKLALVIAIAAFVVLSTTIIQAATTVITGSDLATQFAIGSRPAQLDATAIQTVLAAMPGFGATKIAALVAVAPITTLAQLQGVTWTTKAGKERKLSEKD